AAAVAVVAATALVGQVQPKLRAQRPLDHGLLEALEHGLNPGRIHRAGNQLLEKILRDINGRRHHRCLLLAWHTCSLAASWYASHTKFLTRSARAKRAAFDPRPRAQDQDQKLRSRPSSAPPGHLLPQ